MGHRMITSATASFLVVVIIGVTCSCKYSSRLSCNPSGWICWDAAGGGQEATTADAAIIVIILSFLSCRGYEGRQWLRDSVIAVIVVFVVVEVASLIVVVVGRLLLLLLFLSRMMPLHLIVFGRQETTTANGTQIDR